MLSSICSDCKKLEKGACNGIKAGGTYTGCAQKETDLTSYGQRLLKEFKLRCVNVIGHDYLDKVCDSPNGTTLLNHCVASDEGLVGWLLFEYEDIPQEIMPQLKEWAHNDDNCEISVILYKDRDMAEFESSYTTKVGRILAILKAAINVEAKEEPAEKYEVVEILGQKGLFTMERVYEDKIPVGLFAYDLRESDNPDQFEFGTIEPQVTVNHAGSVILLNRIDFGDKGYIEFDYSERHDNSPNFTGEEMTIEEFVKDSEEYKAVAENKKPNAAYWDSIDHITEDYVKSISLMGYLGKKLDDNDLLEIGKEITEKATEILKNEYGYEFPYVDKNF